MPLPIGFVTLLMAPGAPPAVGAESEPTAQNVDPPKALRENRHWLGLGAGRGHSFAPDSASREAIALALEGGLAGRLALRFHATFFQPFNSPGAQPSTAWPLNESAWSGSLDTMVFIVRGHSSFRMPELYAFGGLGVTSTRPVSVIDPTHRAFSFVPKLTVNQGVGTRFFLTSFLTLGAELRASEYNERRENFRVDNTNFAGSAGPSDPSTWLGANHFTTAVEAQLGFTVFYPAR